MPRLPSYCGDAAPKIAVLVDHACVVTPGPAEVRLCSVALDDRFVDDIPEPVVASAARRSDVAVPDGLSEVSTYGDGAREGTYVDDRAGDPHPIAQRQQVVMSERNYEHERGMLPEDLFRTSSVLAASGNEDSTHEVYRSFDPAVCVVLPDGSWINSVATLTTLGHTHAPTFASNVSLEPTRVQSIHCGHQA